MKKAIIVLSLLGVAVAYVLLSGIFGSTEYTAEPEISATSTPEVVTEYTDMYNDLVVEIHKKEESYWKEKAQLSAERQASDQLAEMFAAQAEEKRLEEQSL